MSPELHGETPRKSRYWAWVDLARRPLDIDVLACPPVGTAFVLPMRSAAGRGIQGLLRASSFLW